ncbi:7-deoxyloganetin glucosyltransferase [Sorghum bicolor]|uniref:Glycosyltransferase n=1 Tax=Sorghum bicolor TaxID=4558 RepID=C5Y9P1_SORBI|nr:7-deoxyloganetin glucosyltransferase [Sorghum bicolor]EES12267.1 hypothetical protein SORBI_3006G100900 [Sorghum bicolor]|eukprot:XP_002447939.1 7-deoxyloganetin glucosyltransferase [Sorghum bicolor]
MGFAAAAADDAGKPHAVLVPFPAQGHVTPMLKLGKILHCWGFHVTFVNSEYNHRRLLRSRGAGALDGLPGFRFATIPDGLPPSDADATQDVPSLCRSTEETCLPHFRALLQALNAASSSPDDDVPPPVTCVVGDGTMSFTLEAAREIGVPCALLWTASACGYMGYRYYRTLIDKGIFPLKEEQLTNGFLDTPVDGMSKHMRLKDFPSFIRSTDPDEFMVHYAIRVTGQTAGADAVVLNTFDELEQEALDAMRAETIPPAATSINTIGPLALLAEQIVPKGGHHQLDALGSNLWKEDVSCFRWLDGRAPRSVVYVNYGSITVMTDEELVEFAWGLANSGHDFLWIIRPDLVSGDAAVLPPEFREATKGRGLLASWCPQDAVLRHEAVGVFLTHSGWNSTLESLCAGVPMLCWPFFAEQQTNCRYKCTEWGVGVEIGHDVRREAVEAKIREAMDGEEGKEMRRRALEWRDTAVRATQPGGRSYANLQKLVTDVLLSGGNGKSS